MTHAWFVEFNRDWEEFRPPVLFTAGQDFSFQSGVARQDGLGEVMFDYRVTFQSATCATQENAATGKLRELKYLAMCSSCRGAMPDGMCAACRLKMFQTPCPHCHAGVSACVKLGVAFTIQCSACSFSIQCPAQNTAPSIASTPVSQSSALNIDQTPKAVDIQSPVIGQVSIHSRQTPEVPDIQRSAKGPFSIPPASQQRAMESSAADMMSKPEAVAFQSSLSRQVGIQIQQPNFAPGSQPAPAAVAAQRRASWPCGVASPPQAFVRGSVSPHMLRMPEAEAWHIQYPAQALAPDIPASACRQEVGPQVPLGGAQKAWGDRPVSLQEPATPDRHVQVPQQGEDRRGHWQMIAGWIWGGDVAKQAPSDEVEELLRKLNECEPCDVGSTFRRFPDDARANHKVALAAVSRHGPSLEYASEALRGDKEIVLAAVKRYQGALQHASEKARADKDVVMSAVKQDGNLLRYASSDLKADEEVVLASVLRSPEALAFAAPKFKSSERFLRAAGLWTERSACERLEHVVLSVRYGLDQAASPYSTKVAVALQSDAYMRCFYIYNPNTVCKGSCDRSFTNRSHPCRGTTESCLLPLQLRTGKPTARSCWRYSFRWHQRESKRSNGFMLQVQERSGLGRGQEIESEMAELEGIKVFRMISWNDDKLLDSDVQRVVRTVKAWYKGGAYDMRPTEIKL